MTRRLGHSPPPAAWAMAEKQRLISTVLNADEEQQEEELEALVQFLQDYEAAHADEGLETGAPEGSVELPMDTRVRALKDILALRASQNPFLRAFRREELPRGRLLRREQVEGWIERQARNQPKPRSRRHGPPIETVEDLAPLLREGKGKSPDAVRLLYGDAKQPKSVWARLDAPLGRLKWQACELMGLYGWNEPDTIAFILADETPQLYLGRATWSIGPAWKRTISLAVSPHVQPKEVADLYANARRRLGKEVKSTPRRDLSEKTGRLAVFAARVNDGRPWKDALRAWNQENPRQRYQAREVPRFSRDCHHAYRRVTGEELHWKRPLGAAGHEHPRKKATGRKRTPRRK